MKTIVNTVYAQYYRNSNSCCATASCTVNVLCKDNFIQGEVLCSTPGTRWLVEIVQKQNGRPVFSISGTKPKGFFLELDSSFTYRLVFKGDKNSVLRLYSTPISVTDIMYSDEI